jgi:hypothetical protein
MVTHGAGVRSDMSRVNLQDINRKFLTEARSGVSCVALQASGLCRVMLRGVGTTYPHASGCGMATAGLAQEAEAQGLPTVLIEEYDAASVREGDKVPAVILAAQSQCFRSLLHCPSLSPSYRRMPS